MNNLITKSTGLTKPFSSAIMNRPLDIFDIVDSLFKNKYTFQNMETLPLDVTETETVYNVNVEAPGVTKDSINIQFDKGYLNISIEANEKKEEKDGEQVILSERYYSKKSRSIYLGQNIDESNIKASYENGVLKLEIPKLAQESTIKKIQIQ